MNFQNADFGGFVIVRQIGEVLIYMFVSPFLAKFRQAYFPYAPANSVGKHFPMYMVLRGGKNGGKSSIVKTGQMLMFGEELPRMSEEVISPKPFEDLKRRLKGIPVLIDEVSNKRAKYLPDIVKNETGLLAEHVDNHATFIFTSNEMQKLRPDLLKRMIVFQMDNQVSDDASIKEERKLLQLQNHLGNALYRRFLREAFPEINSLLADINNGMAHSKEDHPDIFKLASTIFIRVIKDCGCQVPPELRVFQWSDYMSEMVKSEKMLRILDQAYSISPSIFTFDTKNDILRVDFGGEPMNRSLVEEMRVGLPTDVEVKIIGTVMTVKLSEIESYLGHKFERESGFLEKLARFFRGD